MRVSIAGRRAATVAAVDGAGGIIVDFDLPAFGASELTVELAFPDPVRPDGDGRLLGLALQSVELRSLAPAAAPPRSLRAAIRERLMPIDHIAGASAALSFIYDPAVFEELAARKVKVVATLLATTPQLRAIDRVCALAGLGEVLLVELSGDAADAEALAMADIVFVCDGSESCLRVIADALGSGDGMHASLVLNAPDPVQCPWQIFAYCFHRQQHAWMSEAGITTSASRAIAPLDAAGYGVMLAEASDVGLRCRVAANSAANARTGWTVLLLRSLLAAPTIPRERALSGERLQRLVQYDDVAHDPLLPSVAYCRPAGATGVALIPDPYFYFSHAFDDIRLEIPRLPGWKERRPLLFWRGASSHNACQGDGTPILNAAEVPRVDACLRLRRHRHADLGLCDIWERSPFAADLAALARRHELLRPRIAMTAHAGYRFQLDIDGVGNAWATLQRLLLGSCLLKVGSRFEMWFHDRLVPWRHYVPVRADLTDLEERLDWCLEHDDACREIAHEGQELARDETFEAARAAGARALMA